MVLYVLSGAIGLFGTTITILLTLILGRLSKLEDKLDGKVDKEFCDHQQMVCEKAYGHADFWKVFNCHGHTGLPNGSKVTR